MRVHRRAYKFIIAIGGTFIAAQLQAQSLQRNINHPSTVMLQSADSTTVKKHVFSMNGDYYVRNLSFVCRQEWKLEKATRLPLRIRVGSLQQCNYLEGK